LEYLLYGIKLEQENKELALVYQSLQLFFVRYREFDKRKTDSFSNGVAIAWAVPITIFAL
jgi:hypothetical protein